jgi:nitrate reductase gamma subunit
MGNMMSGAVLEAAVGVGVIVLLAAHARVFDTGHAWDTTDAVGAVVTAVVAVAVAVGGAVGAVVLLAPALLKLGNRTNVNRSCLRLYRMLGW